MPVSVGDRLGPYEIIEPIGAGGMGEVWKARDTRLDRMVAIKRSKAEFSDRFAREAKAIAALNHPNICQLYDVGPDYLVMEYVEGSPLKGPLPLSKAVAYAGQILSALDAAHRRGITHRDLKPGNILVTNQHGIKLLDFGLARLTSGADTTLTQAGQRLGTPAYMAPEQWEGKPGDARSDIYSFGCVLYEMLTGRRAVQGNLATLEPAVLDNVVRTCTAESPDDRWQAASDVWRAMNLPAAPAHNKTRSWFWPAVAALLVVGLGWSFMRPSARRAASTGDPVTFAIYPPHGTAFSTPPNVTINAPQFALAPDGRSIVFSAGRDGVRPLLWRRDMDRLAAEPLPGTEDAFDPFWSPDGRWVAFFAEGTLKKVAAAGGPVQVVVSEVHDPRGGAWGKDDAILFAIGSGAIQRVSSAGGQPTPATALGEREVTHRYPHFLPDGRHFVFLVSTADGEFGLYATALGENGRKFIAKMNSSASFASPGYLLSAEENSLLAYPFDAVRLRTTGARVLVAEHTGHTSTYRSAVSSAAATIAYADVLAAVGTLTWFGRNGTTLDTVGPEGCYADFRLSPNGEELAASRLDRQRGVADLWITDFARGSTNRIRGPSNIFNGSPVWSPDGARIIFRAARGTASFYETSAVGAGTAHLLMSSDTIRREGVRSIMVVDTDWSPDGHHVAFSVPDPGSGADIWFLPLTGDKKPFKVLGSPADEMHANFSPDGRQIAYTSNESGKFEVYVQTLPLSDRKWQVSTNGGYEPRWRADGREIFYLSEDRKIMAVAAGPGPSFGLPKALFQTRVPAGISMNRTHYVPSPDGQRFLINTETRNAPPPAINVVTNWTAGLGK
jgi:Tol biopolymer transport system component/predicted Ser/Thr protein kinase